MRAIASFLIFGICIWLFWHYVLSDIIVTHTSGTNGVGGVPLASLDEIHEFLKRQGFAEDKVAPQSDKTVEIEHFSGNYHGSLPFFVTLRIIRKTEAGVGAAGVYVETSYDYHGLRWSAEASSKKAQEYISLFDQFLKNQWRQARGHGA